MTPVPIQIKRLRPNALLPRYMTELAAGMDLHACLEEPLTIGVGQRLLIPTGLVMAIPPGFEGQVRPRSGLALKKGLTLLNSPGTIDADYRGEVGVILINLGDGEVTILPDDRIAQLIIAPVHRALVTEATSLDATGRNEGGFGHTGFGGSQPA